MLGSSPTCNGVLGNGKYHFQSSSAHSTLQVLRLLACSSSSAHFLLHSALASSTSSRLLDRPCGRSHTAATQPLKWRNLIRRHALTRISFACIRCPSTRSTLRLSHAAHLRHIPRTGECVGPTCAPLDRTKQPSLSAYPTHRAMRWPDARRPLDTLSDAGVIPRQPFITGVVAGHRQTLNAPLDACGRHIQRTGGALARLVEACGTTSALV